MQPSMSTPIVMQQGIQEANRRFMEAFNAGDPAAAARAVYTADARVLPPGGQAVRGRESIAAFWQAAAQAMGIQRVDLATLELEPMGDGAYEIGRATITLAGDQQAVGKYVVIWRQEGGQWLWDVDIWNMDA